MGKGKSTGKILFSIAGFAFGAGWLGGGVQFGTSSWLIGGLYGASLGGSIWSATHQPKPESPTYNFDQIMNQVSSDARLAVIYGMRKWGGNQTFHETASNKQSLTKDIVWCEGDIDSIMDVRADDLCIGSNTANPYISGIGPGSMGFFRGMIGKKMRDKWDADHGYVPGCTYSFSDGNSTQSPPSNYTAVGGYKNVAWSRINLKVSEQLSSGNPTITAVVKGKKVLDTRTGSYEWSDNPAMCVRDYLLSKRYGAGHFITQDMLDENSFKEIADYCDELVTTRVPTTLATADEINSKITSLQQVLQNNSSQLSTAEKENISNEITSLQQSLINLQSKPVTYTLDVTPRYSLNIIIAETKKHIEHLQDMFAVFGGFLVFSNNKVGLRCEKSTPVSYDFTDDTIVKDSLEYTQNPIESSPNRYNVKFYDPCNQWTGVMILCEDYVDQKERQKIIPKDVELTGCTSQSQALRLARLYRDKNKLCNIVISFQTATMAMHLEPGDVITVSKKIYPNGTEQYLFRNMPFRILEISEQKGIYSIKAEQYNDSIYNDSLGAAIQVKNYVEIPNPFSSAIQDVSNMTSKQEVFTQKDGTIVSTLTASWDNPTYQFFSEMIVSYSIDNGTTWVNAGTTIGNSFTLQNVLTNRTYLVKLQIENTIGRISSGYISSPIYITGKGEPPSDVTNFSITQKGNDIVVSFTQVPDTDIKYYEVRKGYQWNSGIKVCVIPANFNSWTVSASEEGTMTFWMKAFDNSGGESVNPAQYVMNIIGLPKRNVVLEESTTFNDWIYNGMYEDTDGLHLSSMNKVSDYVHWADMFGSPKQQRTDAYAELPIIDLGENILDAEAFYYDKYGVAKLRTQQRLCDYATFGQIFSTPVTYVTPKYAIETMVGIDIEFNSDNPLSRVDYQYSSSLDLVSWSGWIDSSVSQFYGRYLKIRLIPTSLDGFAPVVIKSAKARVDVPDVEDSVLNVMLVAGVNTVKYNIPFTVPPTLGVFTQDMNGKSVTYVINNVTTTSFDIRLLDGDGNSIPGILTRAIARGY